MTRRPVRVAVDLLGGDHAPDAVVDGALLAARRAPEMVAVTLVGPADLAEHALAQRGAAGALEVVHASQVVAMDENPARAVRAKPDATIRVAARLVRDGAADALVTVGSTGAALAASMFTLGRLPGVTRPPLAVVVPAVAGPVVLLDAGATLDATPDVLAQFAVAGAAYARVRLGRPRPRVGLLSVGTEAGKGDPTRKAAHDDLAIVLADLPVEFAGNVEGSAVALGGVDVVVTDGFTGNVLLKALEAAVALVGTAVAEEVGEGHRLLDAYTAAVARLSPEREGGGVLLGVDGVTVVGHGASPPAAVAGCIATAAAVAEVDLVPEVALAMAGLVAARRAGLRLGPPPSEVRV